MNLLALDGGGIRGLSELIILQRLMYGLGQKLGHPPDSPPKPCEVFDLIAGTSTGGLIAIMLGKLRMDVDTCIEEYVAMAPQIFPVEGFIARKIRWSNLPRPLLGSSASVLKPLEDKVMELVGKAKHITEAGSEARLDCEEQLDGETPCKTFVTVTNNDTKQGLPTSYLYKLVGAKHWM